MVNRRDLFSGGFLVAAAGASQRDLDTQPITRAIDDLKTVVQRGQQVSPELARIREQQRVYLRANQKFPDFLEIGVNVWESVYDWHVRHQQPLAIGRTAEGRYVMTVMFTTLVLRPDQDPGYVGFGFDAR